MSGQAASKRHPTVLLPNRILCLALFALSLIAQQATAQSHAKTKMMTRARPLKAKDAPSPTSSPILHTADANPPAPAQIIFRDGTLLIRANNSDLNQILRGVAQASGMVLSGSALNTRVYGVYGPLDPIEVITELLRGQQLNMMMVGRTLVGAPRELLLTPQEGAPSSPVVVSPVATPVQLDRTGPDSAAPAVLGLGPAATPAGPPPPPQDPDERRQQKLRRLQQMQEPQKPPRP